MIPSARSQESRSAKGEGWSNAAILPALAFFALHTIAHAEPWPDPAPPELRQIVAEGQLPEPQAFDRLTVHGAPRPRHPEAIDADWLRFLGPGDLASTPETHLLPSFEDGPPTLLWEMRKGTSYTSPVIKGERLVYFHRLDDNETVECLHPETGKRYWSYAYPVVYRDRYGFNNGPRASAVIEGDRVITLGVTSVLSCLDLATGQLLWQRDLATEFEVPEYFFGHGACPLVYEDRVIINLGGKDDLCVAAFEVATGKLVWGSRHPWHASYASPTVANLQGEDRLLVFAGGEGRPSTGGLLAIDPESGEILDAFPWRAEKYESVNASNPVPVGDNRVYLSECYDIGGVMLEFDESLKWKELWRAPDFGMHWMTPLAIDGVLYGFRGRNEPDAWLAGYRVDDGKELWRDEMQWTTTLQGREARLGLLRGSLLEADGRVYALGELGTLATLQLTAEEGRMVSRTQLFLARATWSLPVISRGLLYVAQHEDDAVEGTPPRLLCYDLRAK